MTRVLRACARLLRPNPDYYLLKRLRILRQDEGATIGFGPRVPRDPGYQIIKVCKALSLHIQGLAGADIKMFWEDTTFSAAVPENAINSGLKDISKEHVANVFNLVFGYPLSLDPRSHTGDCVEKLNEDGKHVGAVVHCPVEPRDGFVYQRLIDNRIGRDVEDLRTVVIGREFPLVYRKRRSVEDRFSNVNKSVTIANAAEVFSPWEIQSLHSFCERMALDYGEIDVLRDAKDARIYVVDVNKTPMGPPNHLRMSARFKAVERIARSFERQFMHSRC